MKHLNKKYVIYGFVLIISLFFNICLLFYVMRDSTRFYIGGTYETGDNPWSIQSLLISEDSYDKGKKTMEVFMYSTDSVIEKGTATKLSDTIYKMSLKGHNKSYYIVSYKKRIDLIVDDEVTSYKKIANHLIFTGSKHE
ncbi:MAG: hypothetical protein RR524_01150 [Erysipelotrichaceae bacterium]